MTEEERLAKEAADKAAADKIAADKAEADRLEAEAVEAAERLKKDPVMSKAVEKLVAEQLADIKTKLDGAYGARDAAVTEAAKLKEEKRLADIQALKDAGKHKEAAEAELAAVLAENKALKEVNTNLSRDSSVKDSLKGLDFRGVKASDAAFKEIVDQLIQNDKGQWVHKTGVSVEQFVEAYAKDDDNSYLFKPKASSGSGSGNQRGTNNQSSDGSLFKKTQAEVIALAAAGKLPPRNR